MDHVDFVAGERLVGEEVVKSTVVAGEQSVSGGEMAFVAP